MLCSPGMVCIVEVRDTSTTGQPGITEHSDLARERLFAIGTGPAGLDGKLIPQCRTCMRRATLQNPANPTIRHRGLQ